MEVVFDITKPILDQAITQFRMLKDGESYVMNPEVGDGGIAKWQSFPGQLEFYHFGRTVYQVPVEMKSRNPTTSDWFLIHVNLSSVGQRKTVGDVQIEFHKYLPAAILMYGPGLEIDTYFPRGTEAEVCGLRFSRQLLEEYFGDELREVALDKPLTFEDLDPDLEFLLMEALGEFGHKLVAHGKALSFLESFFKKLRKHDPSGKGRQLHSQDYGNLIRTASILRDPLTDPVPSIEELAATAKMSITKFKTNFKQVFGSSPMQYRNKIRLEYAREQLRKRRKSPSELSYELGYAHPSNFTAAYKKHFNALPSAESPA